ncbi:glutathione S-transferase family protein [Rhizobium sp. 18065]|uniref:glutathione S-transferase family protein n=1 Tax=Rhizobium sp. 18065 TaxID=2681411 RepID=UPI001358BA75|nr:glutathione S-transferase family protein [Rhizobium sp. 18065]
MARTLYSLCGTDADRPFSPHCWKIVMALRHKGLDFEERPLPFTAIPTIEGGVSKTVPVLRDGQELISDSFRIALYLEEAYPDQPSLFGGEGGKALTRLVEGYSQRLVHPVVTRIALFDIYSILAPEDQAYFRESRERLLGKTLEEIRASRDEAIALLPERLMPMRHMLGFQPFIGGETPLFADYILFGALQWLRLTSGSLHLPADDLVAQWFERCLDLYEGAARAIA